MFDNIAAYHKAVIELGNDIVITLDSAGVIRDINARMEAISGYSISEIKGKNWFDTFISDETKRPLSRHFKEVILKSGEIRQEYAILTKYGKELFIEWNKRVIRDLDGMVIGVLSVGQDVTDHVRHRRQLIKERWDLIERNKELTCLYGVAQIVANTDKPIDEILEAISSLIPPSLQYSEQATANIVMDLNYRIPLCKKRGGS